MIYLCVRKMKMIFLCVTLVVTILLCTSALRAEEKGCPEPSLILPCTCNTGPFPYLNCANIDDTETLRDVFLKSTRYKYDVVKIEYSVLQFLPADMFQGVQIKELHLRNVTLVQLFDEPPENLQMLDTLHIENTYVFRGMSWDLLADFTHLRILNIYFESIPVLDREFSEQVTKSLKQISFYATETSALQTAVFSDFVNLEKVAIDSCELTELKRNIFPYPFNVKYIYFNDNKLTSIPLDLFTEMPNLQTVGLRHNQLATLPESAFRGSFAHVEYFLLEGNPLTCDCRIYWLLRQKPAVVTGQCESPKGLQGKKIQDIDVDDFKCSGNNNFVVGN